MVTLMTAIILRYVAHLRSLLVGSGPFDDFSVGRCLLNRTVLCRFLASPLLPRFLGDGIC